MNSDQLLAEVQRHFPEAKTTTESLIRYERSQNGKAFAIYLFDAANELPADQKALDSYQESRLAPQFFKESVNLQWNIYFYLVVDDGVSKEDLQQAKALIEADRAYARKFVVYASQISSVLAPPTTTAVPNARDASVLSLWIQRLTEAGLYAAVVGEQDLPRKLERIVSPTEQYHRPTQSVIDKQRAARLAKMSLVQYRRFPVRRHFSFSGVNLIYGPNASGKTSLLEAIELFYCGRNNRNPIADIRYKIEGVLSDGRTETATQSRKLQIFRDRNLNWYGQAEEKANNLYQSFSRFNFLNTDAAVAIASSADGLTENLSKLLIGPDAARTWHDMERVHEALRLELKRGRQTQSELEKNLFEIRQHLNTVQEFQPRSKNLQPRMLELFREYRWQYNPPGQEREFLSALASSLAEFVSLLDQIVAAGWIASPVTAAAVDEYLDESRATTDRCEPVLSEMQNALLQRAHWQEEMRLAATTLNLLEKAAAIIDANVPGLMRERTALVQDLDEITDRMPQMPSALLARIATDGLQGQTLDELINATQRAKYQAEIQLSDAEGVYQSFSRLKEQSERWLQQLRHIASELISTADERDECPLCHTKFAPGKLASHIAGDLDVLQENLGQQYLAEVQRCSTLLDKIRVVEADHIWLTNYCRRSSLGTDVQVLELRNLISAQLDNEVVIRNRLAEIDRRLAFLAASGLSYPDLSEIMERLGVYGVTFDNANSEELSNAIRSCEERAVAARAQLAVSNDDLAGCTDRLRAEFPETNGSLAGYRVEISNLKEKVATTERIKRNLDKLFLRFRWPRKAPLSDLIVAAKTVQRLATDLQQALSEELQNNRLLQEALASREKVDKELQALLLKLQRFSIAYDALDKLMKESSLSSEVENALMSSKAAIERIFSTIHSPREFSGIGSTLLTLTKAIDQSEVKLSEVSTGQRAALALAIFLAQNAQLETAPPVMLIDDPIAHIDDLNSLSFLDYLRELAIRGDRQIFFATANSKLASLFMKKFKFLDDGFTTIYLDRDGVEHMGYEEGAV
ncbi:AAA family ATPase [Afipia broomeae]|uniref:Rad50/SbcC-type AAA domain-containing protein n=1 Tax=Afipia broomeae ATCC 49717 TaxID=883078 RepID=K8P0K4_9BRAD|nr:AAA family ATPase [Afipia broomeae]EKS34239.1 hypothetical protein HMPREF9695_04149 [Afipia broomeae ATCC 49717]